MGLEIIDLNEIEYKDAWEYQETLFNSIIKNKRIGKPTKNYLVLCEHLPVYTLGKNGDQNNLLINSVKLKEEKVSFYKTNRGGDITYHGPGQLVGYPILNLDDYSLGLKDYIHKLEDIVIETLVKYNIEGIRIDSATGVWVKANSKELKKICAVGVKVSRYVTMHGFALNVNTDLKYFDYINPCGFTNKNVTSMNQELGKNVDLTVVKNDIIKNFRRYF